MEKDPENNANSAEKDYGFPFVKVEPLSSPLQNEPSVQPKDEKARMVEQINIVDIPVSDPTSIKFESKIIPESRKKSQVPLLFSLVFLIVIVLASMAYFLYYLPSQEEKSLTAEIIDMKTEEPQILPETLETGNESESILDSLTTEAGESMTIQSEIPNTGFASLGTLIVLDGKEAVSSYHLVVASLPNERIAREEAQVFLDNGKDIYLIFPTGDTRNYRLSVGKYSSFKAASEALPTAKADFNESTWILKY
jgi:uncharacterized protein (UPF0333 family)